MDEFRRRQFEMYDPLKHETYNAMTGQPMAGGASPSPTGMGINTGGARGGGMPWVPPATTGMGTTAGPNTGVLGAGTESVRTTVQPVDDKRLREFDAILQKYMSGKKRLEQRVIAAEQWWKLRNETEARKAGVNWSDDFHPKSGWLHNVLVSKHADAMDNYPEPLVLPREPGDREQADALSAVLPVVLEQAKFERTYSDNWWQKLKTGTAVYKVTWDQDKLGGLGDIAIDRVDLLSIFWEPGVTDIQRSRNLFHCEMQDNETLIEQYPELKDRLKGNHLTLRTYQTDDPVGTEDKSLVVDVYYHVGKELHYCKYVGDTVLYSTENEGQPLYQHGRYPFVFDPLWPVEGSPCGYGYVDLCQNSQIQLDMLDGAFLKNAMVGATPRYFQRQGSGINTEEFLDTTKPIVNVTGGLVSDEALRPIDYKPLPGNYLNFYTSKVQELRETSGNTETSTGAAPSGVTAASAIAALQEASGKTSRDATKAGYRAFAEIVDLCIELIRQFYGLPRQFRITGEQGQQEFIEMSNQPMQPTPVYVAGQMLGEYTPVYDVKVEVQRRNAYSRTAQNDLALQLFNLGFFNPQYATPALSCLEMMDFEGKDELMGRLAQNGTIMGMLQETQQMLLGILQKYEPEAVPQMAAAMGLGEMPAAGGTGSVQLPDMLQDESSVTAKARAQAAKTTEAT